MEPDSTRQLEKPDVFAPSSRVTLHYRSCTRDDAAQSVTGYVIAEENSVLVIEEYKTFTRNNEHRHILLGLETKDVYVQTETQNRRAGQATTLSLWAPPWESRFDKFATGAAFLAQTHDYPELHMIQEGLYEFPDPDRLDKPADWSPDTSPDDPLPEHVKEQNPETAYHPPIDTASLSA